MEGESKEEADIQEEKAPEDGDWTVVAPPALPALLARELSGAENSRAPNARTTPAATARHRRGAPPARTSVNITRRPSDAQ